MDGSYTFVKPEQVYTIGSYAINTLIKQEKPATAISVDICCEMPSSYFNERDYLNYRYFIKRNLYIANVILQLTNLEIDQKNKSETNFYSKQFTFEFQSEFGDSHKPNLILRSNSEPIQFVINFVPEMGTFKLNRFNPTQNNVRLNWHQKTVLKRNSFIETIELELDNNNRNSNNQDGEELCNIPTDLYNSNILVDLRARDINEYLREKLNVTKNSTPNLNDAIKLVKLWLQKRQLNNVRKICFGFSLFFFLF